MNELEQNYFRDLPEERLIKRWKTAEGQQIKKQLLKSNFNREESSTYKKFVGTIKTDWSKEPPVFDLRGLDFSNVSCLEKDEIFGFDLSNCALSYTNFTSAFLENANFSNSDILYSDFSHSILRGCNFRNSNLTMTTFEKSLLEYADFTASWLSHVDFKDCDLGFIKFNRRTDFHNINPNSLDGTSNPLFIEFIRRKQYLKNFKQQNWANKFVFYIWWAISDCGQSFLRWLLWSILIAVGFGVLFSSFHSSFEVLSGRHLTPFSFYYFSVVTFATLGYGDIVPKTLTGEILVVLEVILGYLMLGGLISIFADKFIPRK